MYLYFFFVEVLENVFIGYGLRRVLNFVLLVGSCLNFDVNKVEIIVFFMILFNEVFSLIVFVLELREFLE